MILNVYIYVQGVRRVFQLFYRFSSQPVSKVNRHSQVTVLCCAGRQRSAQAAVLAQA